MAQNSLLKMAARYALCVVLLDTILSIQTHVLLVFASLLIHGEYLRQNIEDMDLSRQDLRDLFNTYCWPWNGSSQLSNPTKNTFFNHQHHSTSLRSLNLNFSRHNS